MLVGIDHSNHCVCGHSQQLPQTLAAETTDSATIQTPRPRTTIVLTSMILTMIFSSKRWVIVVRWMDRLTDGRTDGHIFFLYLSLIHPQKHIIHTLSLILVDECERPLSLLLGTQILKI